MSNWSATQLTDKGRALDAKVTAGTASLSFTKMKLGSGTETAADIPSMTDLTAPELMLGISSCAVSQSDDTICELIAIASSENVQTSFIVRELGVFATDPDDGEILYAVMLDSNPDTMPTHSVASPVTVTYQVNIMSANAASISAVIDPAGLVSVSTLNAAINTHNTGSDSHADLLHLRKPSTAYAVGDIAYSALLPSWAYIECTVGGTTDSGDLTVPSSVVANATFTDGTVTWKIRKVGFDNEQELATKANRQLSNLDTANLACHVVVDSYYDSTTGDWWREYDDGWIEQGGLADRNTQIQTVTLLKPYANNAYTVLTTFYTTYSSDTSPDTVLNPWLVTVKTTTTFNAGCGIAARSDRKIQWTAYGMGASV